ncbi:copper resistance CopC/CopD family protein [Aeromicrobium ponti]|uniref:Copper transport protein n=1 Tax=Cytobacillus oceanisediminis TaxID=665099 RepID=A0A562JD19_9BACI|nr:copper resistance protein CopC [Cytobacillus oceanisediminis]TWH80854.1 copper transport protein [Cytobacillus oceanisediminis]
MQFVRKVLNVIMFAFIINFLIPGISGFAHSNLEQTYPIEGEKLTESPSTIELLVQDPVVLHPGSIKLADSFGHAIELEGAVVDPNDNTHIISNITKDLPDGKYVVKINVVALDGYVLQEEIKFEVVNKENGQNKEKLRALKYSPDDSEIIDGSPEKIDLWFSRPVDITAIGVFDDRQQSIRLKEPYVYPKDPNHIIVEFNEELSKGTYQVTWYARPSGDDTSKPDILDVFYFAVDEFTPIQQVNLGEATNSFWFNNMGLKQLGHWLVFFGISTLFGGAFFNSVIYKHNHLKKWNKLTFVFLLFVIIGEAIILTIQKREIGSLSIIEFISLKFVWIPLLQIILITIGLLFAKVRFAFYGTALFLTSFITGHATYPRYGGYLTIAVNTFHLFAASIWIGGLFQLIIIPKKDDMKDWLKDALPKFSRWALISLIVLIFTGIFMTIRYVPSFSIESFIKSEWGKAVIFKIGATLMVFILGFFQRKTIINLTANALTKVVSRVKVEIIYAVFILIFASLLVVSTPSAAEQGVYPKSLEKENVQLNVAFSPLKPGLNVLTMDFDHKDIEKVEVTLSMPPNYKVTYNAFKVEEGVFKITGNLLHAAGTMNMKVKAIKVNGDKTDFSYKVVIPGEMRFNE